MECSISYTPHIPKLPILQFKLYPNLHKNLKAVLCKIEFIYVKDIIQGVNNFKN